MATVVRMPSVLAGATEATIARWLVKPGDAVRPGTPVAEIETEKALVEYQAELAGTIGRLVLDEGAAGEIGDPIAVLVGPGDTEADIDRVLGQPAATAATAATVANVATVAPRATAGPAATETAAAAPVSVAAPAGRGDRLFASPLVRKLAGQRGIDLTGLTGTGPNGRITRRDLERHLALAAVPATAPPAAGPAATAGPAESAAPVRADPLDAGTADGAAAARAGAVLIPHTPMRRAIARRLTESKATVPHFYLTADCVVDELLALRARVNETLAAGGPGAVRVSVNDFVIAAVAAAFGDVPAANVIWSEEGLRQYRSVDISIAVATDGGLVTPVLRGVEGMRLSAIARESAALARRARDRQLRQHELEGGTFAISNLGMFGTTEFSAIINPPQSGILAVGAARSQPVAADGAVVAATVMRCTLSVDHRAIDGALAARWLAAFSRHLADPLGALA